MCRIFLPRSPRTNRCRLLSPPTNSARAKRFELTYRSQQRRARIRFVRSDDSVLPQNNEEYPSFFARPTARRSRLSKRTKPRAFARSKYARSRSDVLEHLLRCACLQRYHSSHEEGMETIIAELLPAEPKAKTSQAGHFLTPFASTSRRKGSTKSGFK